MSRRRKEKEKIEFRYYEIPQHEPLLALMGEKWKQTYGKDIDYLHFHNLMEIGYCHYGTGELIMEENSASFTEGMVSIIPKNILHNTASEEDTISFWEYLFIDVEQFLTDYFTEDSIFLKELIKRINKRGILIHTYDNQSLTRVVECIFTEMKDKKEFYLDNVKALLVSLLLEIARINHGKEGISKLVSTSGTQIARALDYVSKNYYRQLRIIDLAEECHLSETHFRRIFEETMNMTPVEYINLVRTQMACNLIAKGNNSMNSVATKVGYQTPSTFNRNFKRFVGVCPNQWKKNSDNYESKLLNYRISSQKGW